MCWGARRDEVIIAVLLWALNPTHKSPVLKLERKDLIKRDKAEARHLDSAPINARQVTIDQK